MSGTITIWRVIRNIRKAIELFQIVVELVRYLRKETRHDGKLNLIVDRIDKLIKEIAG